MLNKILIITLVSFLGFTFSISNSWSHTPKQFAGVPNNSVCDNSITYDNNNNRIWNKDNYLWINEAKRRGLNCGVEYNSTNVGSNYFSEQFKKYENYPKSHFKKVMKVFKTYPNTFNDEVGKALKLEFELISEGKLTSFATSYKDVADVIEFVDLSEIDIDIIEKVYKYLTKELIPNHDHGGVFLEPRFKQRILKISRLLDNTKNSTFANTSYLSSKKNKSISYTPKQFAGVPNNSVCDNSITYDNNNNRIWNKDNYLWINEAKSRGLNCGIRNIYSKTAIVSKPKPIKPSISSAELDAERKKRIELERKLAAIEAKQKQKQQRINKDNQKPIINAFVKQDSSNATIFGRVTDNTEVAEVLVDGQVQQLKSNGTFETSFYIPRTGKTIEIIAFDVKGNKASEILKLERGEIQSADKQQFKSLDPSRKRVKSNPNALALIIGISDYENTKASALYADSDAKMFYDYANLKLGIPSSNIKELVNDSAERIDITRAIKTWLLKRTVTDKTDIYVFFAGHGLATDDGKDVYLLPYDGVPDLLEDSAIQRKELFADIQSTKPRSVTVFLDTCYSGGTRNEEILVSSLRPIILPAKEQVVPSNFTVLSAAQGNQTSQSLEEVKHGLFSYYTMLGMEGGADANNDNQITARELHAFIKDKVERQSQFRQTPELQGDKDRVLVHFN